MSHIIEEHKVINVGASAFVQNSSIFENPTGLDVINLSNWRKCIFILQIQANIMGGRGEFYVESCDDTVPTTATPIPSKYRKSQPGTDTYEAWHDSDNTTPGYFNTFTDGGADQIYEILVSADDLVGDDRYVRLSIGPLADACMGSVIAILFEPRYAEAINATVLV